jgi:hypothetical protein
MNSVEYLILGHGQTALALSQKIKEQKPQSSCVSTSRQGPPHVLFNLEDDSTWANLPKAQYTFWTFPPSPLDWVQEFYKSHHEKLGHWIVVGSTSALTVSVKNEWVNEKTPLDLSIERVQAEKYLMDHGATLILSSGIYGSGRSPLQWVEMGYVGKSSKYVNMVHVDDLASFLFQATKKGKKGELYIASNNHPEQWQEIIENWESRGLVQNVLHKESSRASKRIDNSWSIAELGVKLQYPHFADSIS